MRNTANLPADNQFKPYSEKEQALGHINQKLLKMARLSANLADSELSKANLNAVLATIAAQLKDMGDDLVAWLAIQDT